jgi:hypothetical protein
MGSIALQPLRTRRIPATGLTDFSSFYAANAGRVLLFYRDAASIRLSPWSRATNAQRCGYG